MKRIYIAVVMSIFVVASSFLLLNQNQVSEKIRTYYVINPIGNNICTLPTTVDKGTTFGECVDELWGNIQKTYSIYCRIGKNVWKNVAEDSQITSDCSIRIKLQW